MRLTKLSDAKLVAHIKDRKEAMFDFWAPWHQEARDAYDFIAGKMWSDEDIAFMESEGKVPVAFNKASVFIDSVLGQFVNNPQDIRCFPRTMGAAKMNEILTAAVDQARDNADATHEENAAARDMLITGIGVINATIDYSLNPNGEFIQPRISPLDFAWDPNSSRQNFADAKDMVYVKMVSKDRIKELWPDSSIDAAAGGGGDGGAVDHENPIVVTNKDRYASGNKNTRQQQDDEIEVIHYCWFETVDLYRVKKTTETGEADFDDMNAEEFIAFAKDAKRAGIDLKINDDFIRSTRKIAMQAFVAENELLDKTACLYPDNFPYLAITGKRDETSGHWYGMARALRDPQMWFNKMMSEVIHIMSSNSNGGGLIAEEGAFEDERTAQEDWSNPSKIVTLRRGYLGKVMPKPAAPYPASLDRIMAMAGQAMKEVTGVNPELMGMTERDQPGVLEYQRRQAALGTFADVMDAMRRYRKSIGEYIVHLVTHQLADGRLVRIAADVGQQYIPLLKNDEAIEYDVIVDQSATAPNEKERTAAVLQQLLPMALKAGIMPPPDMLDYLPLPTGLVEKWKQQLAMQMQMAQQGGGQPNPDEQKAQAEMAMAQQKAQMDAALAQQKLEIERQKALLDAEKGRANIAAQEVEARMNVQMMQQKMLFEQQMADMKLQFEQQKLAVATLQNRQKIIAGAVKRANAAPVSPPQFVNGKKPKAPVASA